MTNFVVLSLPRCRTYWLSRLLDCDHDPSRHFRSREDAVNYFLRDGAAAVDTALGFVWHEFARLLPNVSAVVVHRPLEDVMESLDRIGVAAPRAMLETLSERLMNVAGMHMSYSQLDNYAGCARLYHSCFGTMLPEEDWLALKDRRLECDFAAYRRDALANAEGLRAVFGGGV